MKNIILLIAMLALFSVSFTDKTENRSIASTKISKKETRTKIMVIDTGLLVTSSIKPFLCKTGHKSFIYGQNPLRDAHGHGTNVAGLISKGMDPTKHCLVIVKFWDTNMKNVNTMELVRAALDHALKIEPAYVNMSLGGFTPDHLELVYIKRLLNKGTKLAVAAGNDRLDLDKGCVYFPACYKIQNKNFRVVGSLTQGKRPYSNYGTRVTHWEDGTEKGYKKMTGTSQATAINMSNWIKE